MVDLASEQAAAAIEALSGLGLVPSTPVDPLTCADPDTRQEWIHDKGMTVLSLHDPQDPRLVVDLFVDPPSDFEALWSTSEHLRLDTTTVRVVGLDDLIAMKRSAGRPRDLLDVEELEQIQRLKEAGV